MSNKQHISERPDVDISVNEYGDSDFLRRGKRIWLSTNYRRSNDTYWYQGLEFDSRKAWFDFVKKVNAANKKLKKANKDKDGMPIFEEAANG